MQVYFITSNPHKFEEVKKILGTVVDLGRVSLELIEPQADELEAIAEYKLRQAFEHVNAPVVVEDAGLFIEALNSFPGPYSKYVYKTIGCEGTLRLLEETGNRRAYFKAVAGYYDGKMLKLFEGRVDGRISEEMRGGNGFGFDPIFMPEGHDKTVAEDYEYKKRVSHRYKAFKKLKEWLVTYVV